MTRETGVLVDWRDERGFGFIRRPGTAGKIYVHMKSIGKSVDRPKHGDKLEYTVGADKTGRPVALDVIFVRDAPSPAPAPKLIVDTIASFSFLTHFDAISKGVIDFRDLFFFGTLIAVCLFSTAAIVDLKKGG